VLGEVELYVNTAPLTFKGSQSPFATSTFVVLGVPFDSTSTYRPGSRFAPYAIREASINIEGYSWRYGVDVGEVKVHDLGDLLVALGDIRETISRVERVVRALRGAGKLPILLGGEHTITYGAVRGLGGAAIVCFDAHLDMRDEYPQGVRLSHATFMRRLIEDYGPDSVVMVGVRAACREEVEYARREGVEVITSRECLREGPSRVAERVRGRVEGHDKVYISVDIDVLDPSYAPGVANPEPMGLSLEGVLEVLSPILDGRVVGLDVVEVCPPYDNGLAAIHAAKLLFEELASLSRPP